jgi:hypothetical protein
MLVPKQKEIFALGTIGQVLLHRRNLRELKMIGRQPAAQVSVKF